MADLTLGKIQAALVSASNEVALAAANFNLDFTLVKFEAPKEFQPVKSILTPSRRKEAEAGPTHVIARRLAALFEGVNVSTPDLLKAYGTRVSEISLEASSRATAGCRSSIFSEYLGIDATSIWAAATSSETGGSVQVHLLACLIARMWNPAEAVSIWDEIVACRRREIAQKFDKGSDLPTATLFAATQQDIPRDGLAVWDASARSWLRTADSIKSKEQTQCSLILKNVNLPVNNEAQLYSSVMHAWTTGMQTLDKILSGTPVEVQDGALLLAIYSWHIYPDMMVYGLQGKHQFKKEVLMGDTLVSPSGMVTLGLSKLSHLDADGDTTGVYWSMPLERFKFYGKAVRRTRNLQDDASRLSFRELLQANLGAILGRWRIPRNQWTEVIRIIVQTIMVYKRCQGKGLVRDRYRDTTAIDSYIEPAPPLPVAFSPENNWTDVLLRPALEYLHEPEDVPAPMALGARRVKFIKVHSWRSRVEDWPFLFGLCKSMEAMQGLLLTFEDNAKFLQNFFESRGMDVSGTMVVSPNARCNDIATEHLEPGTKYRRLGTMRIIRAESTKLIPGALSDPNFQPKTATIELMDSPTTSNDGGTKRALCAESEATSQSLPVEFVGPDGRTYHALGGSKTTAVLYVDSAKWQTVLASGICSQLQPAPKDLSWAIETRLIAQRRFSEHFTTDEGWRRHIDFLYILSKTYLLDSMKGATISCRVLHAPLESPWEARPPLATLHHDEIAEATLRALCYFDSGSIDIKQHDTSRIIGFSSRDSLFVRSEVYENPHYLHTLPLLSSR
jgi:hypothetical protein